LVTALLCATTGFAGWAGFVVPRWRTILRVVLPTTQGGIVTGIMLGVARLVARFAGVRG
jgi:ABC-type phosphate transport system permease subunit